MSARTTVFHDGFAAGTGFAITALVVSLVLLPALPRHDGPIAA